MTTDPAFKDDCTSDRLYVDYTSIASTVEAGSLILLDDGLIGLRVGGWLGRRGGLPGCLAGWPAGRLAGWPAGCL